MIKIGFAKQDLAPALRPAKWPVREERVEAVSMYIADERQESLWIVLDFMDFNFGVIREIREAVRKAISIDETKIHVLTNHNHGGGSPDFSVLSALCAICAQTAKETAKQAKMRALKGTTGKQINILRRKYIPEIGGVSTLFYGASEEDGFDASPFIEKTIRNIKDGYIEYYGKVDTDRAPDPFLPGDETIFALQFCDENDNIIGTVVRFAAHAVCCNRDGSFSSDYPYHIRKITEEHFGGISLFFNGPCAEIAPGMTSKTDGSEKKIGRFIAEKTIEMLTPLPFMPIESFDDKTEVISLPVRKEVIANYVEHPEKVPDTLPERRMFFENERYKNSMPFLREKYTCGEEKLTDTIDISFGMLRLGDFYIAAFPGETFYKTGKAFCDALQNENICTVTEHGRTVMYMPPEEDCARGGYESVCRVTDINAETILRQKTIEAMQKFIQ